MTYTNSSGQEASPAAPADFGQPSAAQLEFAKTHGNRVFMPPLAARTGREGIDVTKCQAPTAMSGPLQFMRALCDRPPICVIVENKPRPDGAIGGMALCELCYKAITATQKPSYAKMTPIVKE